MKLILAIPLLIATIIYSCQSYKIQGANEALVHIQPVADDLFHVRMKHAGNDYNLRLKRPETSIFGDAFRSYVMTTNENGENEFEDVTPTQVELDEIENSLYVDHDANAVVKIRKNNNDFHMEGVIDNLRVHNKDGVHYVRVKPENTQAAPAAPRINDYIDLKRPDTGPNLAVQTRQSTVTTGNPEVLVVFDYANTQQFAGNTQAITEYVSIFYKAVNSRYATFSDPAVVAKISGLVTVAARTSQPYMESGKISGDADSAYDMNIVLSEFSKWLFKNLATLPKFDVSALISGENWKAKDANGAYQKGIAGLAWLGGACWKNPDIYYGASVNADKGGFYDGTYTAAHELAHNLNSPHDGDSANTCSWEDGFIMSYKGWGTKNKFFFSTCTQTLIKNFINSNNGACVKTLQSTSQWAEASVYPGNKYDMTAQCNKYIGVTNAKPEAQSSPSANCINLKCRVPVSATSYSIYTLNRPALEGSACATNMVCRNGDCVSA